MPTQINFKEQQGVIDGLKKDLGDTKNLVYVGFIVLILMVVGLLFAAGAWWTTYMAEKKAAYQDWIDTINKIDYQLENNRNFEQYRPMIEKAPVPTTAVESERKAK